MIDRTSQDAYEAPEIRTPNKQEFAILGLHSIAYARWNEKTAEVRTGDVEMPRSGYSIHAANGQMIGWAPSLDLAHQAIRSHDLAPVTVH